MPHSTTFTEPVLQSHYDFVIIGSGFGGSVSALRLAEKGYNVLVLEQGKRFRPDEFPKTNWNLKRWIWLPFLGFSGPFRMTFLRHITVFSGVGVGGGSLVYGNTLPIPKHKFFTNPSWGHLARWQEELKPFYEKARTMLGATRNPFLNHTDQLMADLSEDLRKSRRNDNFCPTHEPTDVAVYFGKPDSWSEDPYFSGLGPPRKGCTLCGACMTGCRHDAKNTLDKNYLYLAEKKGAKIMPLCRVTGVRPWINPDSSEANPIYKVEFVKSPDQGPLRVLRARKTWVTAKHVIFAGGVLGTLSLLHKMRQDPQGLPLLSPQLGKGIRTNNESILAVTTSDSTHQFSEGIAISSIIHTDEDSHLEPVRYGKGSGFFRILIAPHAPGEKVVQRMIELVRSFARDPRKWLSVLCKGEFSSRTLILLYMRSLEETLEFASGKKWWGFSFGLRSKINPHSKKPTPFLPEATQMAQWMAEKVKGVVSGIFLETLLGTPSTAHILGGCCMGENSQEGVIDKDHHVFGYPGLMVVDGSSISANPGVNPSLTIAALAERAMAKIPRFDAKNPQICTAQTKNATSDGQRDEDLYEDVLPPMFKGVRYGKSVEPNFTHNR